MVCFVCRHHTHVAESVPEQRVRFAAMKAHEGQARYQTGRQPIEDGGEKGGARWS